jgi:hypothetical protein
VTWNTSTSLPRLSRAHIARIGSAASDAARGDVYAREAFIPGGIATRPVMLKLVGKQDRRTTQGRTMRLER